MYKCKITLKIAISAVLTRIKLACKTDRQQSQTIFILTLMNMLVWAAMDASLFCGLLFCTLILIPAFVANLIDPISCSDSEAAQ